MRRKAISIAALLAVGGGLCQTPVFAADASGNFESSVDYSAYRTDDSPYSLRASDLIGADVINAEDEDIGDVDDIILTRDGKEVMVVMEIGGFLGLGEKLVSMPYSELRIAEDGEEVYLATAKESLESAPDFRYIEGEERGRARLLNRTENAIESGWTRVKEEWQEFKVAAAERWDRLTDEDLEEIDGDRENLVERLHERYELDRKQAGREADEWQRNL